MKNNDTGEFELVLGNKQLLSGFFIIVILFGVFFTMGYIVGRNSSPSPRQAAAASTESGNQSEGRPQAASRPPEPAPEASAASAEPAGSEKPSPSTPQPTTQPAREPETSKASVKEAKSAAASMEIVEPEAGQPYLQVMAVKRPVAEDVLKTLRAGGFKAIMASGPNDLVRVLVGPFKDAADMGKTKADLENAGFHPIPRK